LNLTTTPANQGETVALHEYGKLVKFARNEDVDIHVRKVTLDPEGTKPVECVEIREFLKGGEVYGHGLVIPVSQAKDLNAAFSQLGLLAAPSVGK
jgi:hypothetical protein